MDQPADARHLRASHEDRESVVDVLQQAAGDGRLEIDELHERLEAAWRARTWGDLDVLVADLPGVRLPWHDPSTTPPGSVPAVRATGALGTAGEAGGPAPLVISAPLTNQRRDGAWEVPPRLVLEPSVASILLDVRAATCRHPRVEVDVHGGVGNVTLVLAPSWTVDLTALRTGWGSVRDRHRPEPGAAGPRLVVTGGIGMGTLVARGSRFYDRRTSG